MAVIVRIIQVVFYPLNRVSVFNKLFFFFN